MSATSDDSGNLVPDSTARYTPFGDWRTEPGTNPDMTDRGYTGHAHNNSSDNDLGLIYMNARYYVPGIGRFASADTIVPDPANPQSFNRYSYVLNSPMRYIDPSGHYNCNAIDENCAPANSPPPQSDMKPLPICDPLGSCNVLMIPRETRIDYMPVGSTGTPVGEIRNSISQGLGYVQLLMDAIESYASIQGSIVHIELSKFFLALGSAEGPPGVAAAALGSWLAGIPLDTAETAIGWVDFGVNGFSNIIGGTTYFDDKKNELVIGQDTIVTLVEQGVDMFPYGPFGTEADVVINAVATSYDLGKVTGIMPNYLEIRVPQVPTKSGGVAYGPFYVVIYDNIFNHVPPQ